MLAVEEIIAKSLSVSEVSQIARAEKRARDLMSDAWDDALKSAVNKMIPMLLGTSTLGKVMGVADNILNHWADNVTERYLGEIERAYYLARTAAWKKVTGQTKGSLQYDTPEMKELKTAVTKAIKKPPLKYATMKPSFDLADEAAVNSLKEKEVFWIGDYYKKGVRNSINNSAKGVIETGRGRSWGADQLRKELYAAGTTVKVPAGFNGTARQYFQGVVANAVTVARVQGQMRSFIDLGVTRYEIVNPLDERTCETCSHMNGKIFTVSQGTQVMEGEIAAKDPAGVKAAHPWKSTGELKQISPKAGPAGAKDAQKLADAGQSLPPFHFRCRCTADVSDEAGSFTPLEAMPIGKPVKIGPAVVAFGNAVRQKLGQIKATAKNAVTKAKLRGQEARFERLFERGPMAGHQEEMVGAMSAHKEFDALVRHETQYTLNEWKALDAGTKNTMRHHTINQLLMEWQRTSADSSARALALQLAANKEFGLKAATSHFGVGTTAKHALEKAKTVYVANKELFTSLRKFLRQQYNMTQRWLADQGIKNVYVFRGMHWLAQTGDVKALPKEIQKYNWAKAPSKKLKATLQPMSSFSASGDTARNFALQGDYAAVVMSEVPATRIIGVPTTVLGHPKELEFVVLGGEANMNFVGWETINATVKSNQLYGIFGK